MADLYAMLATQLNQRHGSAAEQTLLRLCRQPGFAGVRQQSWGLCQFARSRGYGGRIPFLFHVQKVSHGPRMQLDGRRGGSTW